MTPATRLLDSSGVPYTLHQFSSQASSGKFGQEAVRELNVAPERVFKTLIINDTHKGFATMIVPVTAQLNLKMAAQALGVKRAEMAQAAQVQRLSGYVIGGVSPLGQKQALTTRIDHSALKHKTILVSAGRRGLEIELCPQQLAQLCQADFTHLTALG